VTKWLEEQGVVAIHKRIVTKGLFQCTEEGLE